MSEPVRRIYRGFVELSSNGEEEDILHLDKRDGVEMNTWDHKYFLAGEIQEDIDSFGSYLSVKCYVSNVEFSEEEIREQSIKHILGIGESKYGMCYSECTGYLWTDEHINVGGHDLLTQIKSYYGSFLQLEITYSREIPPKVEAAKKTERQSPRVIAPIVPIFDLEPVKPQEIGTVSVNGVVHEILAWSVSPIFGDLYRFEVKGSSYGDGKSLWIQIDMRKSCFTLNPQMVTKDTQ